jgi:hypothetical protein
MTALSDQVAPWVSSTPIVITAGGRTEVGPPLPLRRSVFRPEGSRKPKKIKKNR